MLNTQALLWEPASRQVSISLDPQLHQQLNVDDIEKLLKKSRFREFEPHHDLWEKTLTELKLENCDAPIPLRVATQVDGSWQLQVEPDLMALVATITLPRGGKPATLEQLLPLIKAQKVQHGLSRRAIKGLLECNSSAQPGSKHQATIAQGKPPSKGKDGYLERLVALPSERKLTPQKKDEQRVDMRNLGSPKMVGRGDLLMRRHPPQPGKNGYDLYGTVLPAERGQVAAFIAGDGAEISPNDPHLIIAARTGLPMEINNGIAVEELLSVNEVTVRTGNLNFIGAIEIKGNVEEGMLVEATGSIHIGGSVEGAIIKAGGDILVNQGVIGRQREDGTLAAQLQAGGNIQAQYAQYTDINAIGDISVELHCQHCLLQSEQNIFIGDPQRGQGGLIGGKATARRQLYCVELGAKAGAETRVTIGRDYHDLKRQIEQLHHVPSEISKEIITLQLHKKKLLTEGTGQAEITAIDSLVADHQSQLNENQQQLEQLETTLADFYQHVNVQVLKKLHPRVAFEIGKERFTSIEEAGPSKVAVDQGTLIIESFAVPKWR
ncbi:DUF342 domain-containing protein [Ferrimonas lipolytica]|uniref:DUF342 domain-containing protein n=1 Tax=Ferrimonas lipolytica TaxID=2724191 RepID=A0A6H1U8Z2_9GAMM|nr:FapA family protein [Ferrimonas lipolytica]QIZ75515.1 DUF342 domain-containing protein [Ferrimonas lipolytica]